VQNIHSVLKQYFGYDTFRPLQEDIIRSILNGKDTLALLPTGGGKSICFHVPALSMEGICIVISPLIALMLDQVENLRKKNIKATALWSGMTKRELDAALNNCVYGDQKFLYISPERLATDVFRERLQKMNVNLLAVDEAHCISQWGYDFRPPYLEIAEVRKRIPQVPVLAVTATATMPVCDDIQEKLAFKEKNIFRGGFARKNINLIVRHTENKEEKLLEIVKKIQGSGIVYVRNRRKTKDIAGLMKRHHIAADYYHAGLDARERNTKQSNWIQNKTKVIVCTNAFGMGIDKPDVRFVIHWDVPDSPEAYFQEAGRAGRDNKRSYAGLLFHAGDIADLKGFFALQYPPIAFIKQVYHALCNFLQIAIGAGKNEVFDFDIITFCKQYKWNAVQVNSALKILQRHNYIYSGDVLHNTSNVKILVDKESLYRFQVENRNWENFIKKLLRIAPGIFDDYTPIHEKEIARYLAISESKCKEKLAYLQKLGILKYNEAKTSDHIILLTERLTPDNLHIDTALYQKLNTAAEARSLAMQQYVLNKTQCRMQMILDYFGEKSKQCGYCDICVEKNKLSITGQEFDVIYDWLKKRLENNPEQPESIYKAATVRKEKLLEALQYMKDNKIILHTKENVLVWKG
jgi:ATP-dependent DNA helicase RecQ